MGQQKEEIVKPVTIALTDSQKKSIEDKAKKEGRSVSNYIRQILIKHA